MLTDSVVETYDLGPSKSLAVFLGFGHVAGWVCCVVAVPNLWMASLSGLVLAFSAWKSVWRVALKRSPHSVTEIEIRGGRCILRTRAGQHVEGCVAGSSRVTPWLVVLTLAGRASASRRHVVVPYDALAEDAFRRLRVWLLWWPHQRERRGDASSR